MWVEAILTRDDMASLLEKCTPVTIHIGSEGTLTLDHMTDVSLVVDVGLRVACSATVRWPVLGVHVPATIRSLIVVLKPEVQRRADHETLVFKLVVEQTDLSLLPTILDESVAAKVNQELSKVDMAWDFTHTLSHSFRLPESLESLDLLELGVTWGQVRVTSEAMVFAVSFQSWVTRRTAGERAHAASNGDADAGAPEATLASHRPMRASMSVIDARALKQILYAGLATVALTGTFAYALGRSAGRRGGIFSGLV